MANTNDLTLVWEEDFDHLDNSIFKALSLYSSETGEDATPDIYWRIKQEIIDNKIVWIEAHDGELMGDTEQEYWSTLEEAKESIQQAHVNLFG